MTTFSDQRTPPQPLPLAGEGHISNDREWKEAGIILTTAIQQKLGEGNMGIAELVKEVQPLWRRYEAGERTDGLLEEIKKLRTKKTS